MNQNGRLSAEEYIEQAYFFKTCLERLEDNMALQDVFSSIHEELLATTRLPVAIQFLFGEMVHNGKIGEGMKQLSHYFTPFQSFIVQQAEEERSRFDLRTAFLLLQRQAEYLSKTPCASGLFVYQFESLSRNRLGFDQGMVAIGNEPFYPPEWQQWILKIRFSLGTVDFADLIYSRSELYVRQLKSQAEGEDVEIDFPVLFGEQEGRIAKANHGRDPLYLFAALQRHLGHPEVPKPKVQRLEDLFSSAVEMRFQQLEAKLQLLEAEMKGQLDLSDFYVDPKNVPKME